MSKIRPLPEYITYARNKAIAATLTKKHNIQFDVCEDCLQITQIVDKLLLCECFIHGMGNNK